jgi:preprotein translocase subunit SecF
MVRARSGAAWREDAVAIVGPPDGAQAAHDIRFQVLGQFPDLEGGMMSRLGQLGGRLYRGEVSVNFVGRQKMWYAISGLILVISVIALLVRGLNFSVEFTGGSIFQFPSGTASQGGISRVVTAAGGGDSVVQHVSGLTQSWHVQTESLSNAQSQNVENALEKAFNVNQKDMSVQLIGPTWGSQISSKAAEALIIFLVVIVVYLTIAFEWRMAAAAFVALLHDILITVGVYALAGFQVAPASVIGLLTILGYSLYDTVVVFDKVRENTAGLLTSARSTYSQAANLALNQTLVRSINTSLTALLPVASILFIGSGLLGAGTLEDLSLVLFVGMMSGTYSSICIATPVLADLKEREGQYRELARRVTRRESGGRAAERASARTPAVAIPDSVSGPMAEDTAGERATAENTAAQNTGTDADEVTVYAAPGGRPAARRTTEGASPSTSRQQPRRGGSAQRRPGARKKRR